MPAPTFIQEAETVWDNAGSHTTASFAVTTGDILAAYGVGENQLQTVTISDSQSLTWAAVPDANSAGNFTYTKLWTATTTATGNMTVTFTGSVGWYSGGNVLTFRNAAVGANNGNRSTASPPSVNITTTAANSAVVFVNGDWAAGGAAYTYLTNAGTFTEQTYFHNAAAMDVYGGYHANAGAIGTYAVGFSTPNMNWNLLTVEIQGTSGPGFRPTFTPIPFM